MGLYHNAVILHQLNKCAILSYLSPTPWYSLNIYSVNCVINRALAGICDIISFHMTNINNLFL